MGVMVLFFRSSKLMRSQIVLKFVPQGGKMEAWFFVFIYPKTVIQLEVSKILFIWIWRFFEN